MSTYARQKNVAQRDTITPIHHLVLIPSTRGIHDACGTRGSRDTCDTRVTRVTRDTRDAILRLAVPPSDLTALPHTLARSARGGGVAFPRDPSCATAAVGESSRYHPHPLADGALPSSPAGCSIGTCLLELYLLSNLFFF